MQIKWSDGSFHTSGAKGPARDLRGVAMTVQVVHSGENGATWFAHTHKVKRKDTLSRKVPVACPKTCQSQRFQLTPGWTYLDTRTGPGSCEACQWRHVWSFHSFTSAKAIQKQSQAFKRDAYAQSCLKRS